MCTRKPYIFTLLLPIILLVMDLLRSQSVKAQCATDSIFFAQSRPITFRVNTTYIRQTDAQWLADSLISTLQNLGPNVILLGRSAASPEGPLGNNHRLAQGRYVSVRNFLEQRGVNTSRICFDVVDEEYELLVENMRLSHDIDYEIVKNLVNQYSDDIVRLKQVLKSYDSGRLWRRLLREYFPQLRAVRIMAYDLGSFHAESLMPGTLDLRITQLPQHPLEVHVPEPVHYRRECLSVKTNLLELLAYVPQYGFCPMPNVAIEYYPRHGHWTYGASVDFPWWIGNTTNHKYFELNNYQLEARYYLRNSDLSYSDEQLFVPTQGQAAFRGFYLQAYAHAFLYQIGFSAQKGWIGEGVGGGLGLGYVLPLTRGGHWRLDFGLQLGVFVTKYDPYIYGCPVEKIDDGLYYYDYTGDADLFKKREYSLTWIGPTRIGVSISYDLFYRPNHRKGFSLHKKEAVWDR